VVPRAWSDDATSCVTYCGSSHGMPNAPLQAKYLHHTDGLDHTPAHHQPALLESQVHARLALSGPNPLGVEVGHQTILKGQPA
jgi:hypothetical protein